MVGMLVSFWDMAHFGGYVSFRECIECICPAKKEINSEFQVAHPPK